MSKREKSAVTKRVDRVRHKIERAITWAKSNGLEVNRDLYCIDGQVCPLAAVYVRDNGLEEGNKLRTVGNTDARLARALGITELEAESFIGGVDNTRSAGELTTFDDVLSINPTPRRVAMFKLGQRIAIKYIDV